MTSTIIIESSEDFNLHFSQFKESARINSIPNVFLVGLDIEFIDSSNFPDSFKDAHKWTLSTNHKAVCLIQISTGDLCLVINLVKMRKDIPNSLFKLIQSDSWIKVGVGIESDLRDLSDNFLLGFCGGGIEIKNLALLALIKKPNLESLYTKFVALHTKPKTSICNWSVELSKSQLEYAATDAIMSFKLFKAIIQPSVDNMIVINSQSEQNDIKIDFVNFVGPNNVMNKINKINEGDDNFVNYVGILNERAQKMHIGPPKYNLVNSIRCSDNSIIFTYSCSFNGKTTTGEGNNKKSSKNNSAKNMFDLENS